MRCQNVRTKHTPAEDGTNYVQFPCSFPAERTAKDANGDDIPVCSSCGYYADLGFRKIVPVTSA